MSKASSALPPHPLPTSNSYVQKDNLWLGISLAYFFSKHFINIAGEFVGQILNLY